MNALSRNLLIRLVLGSVAILPTMAGAVDFEIAPFVGYRFGGNFEDSITGQSVDAKESVAYGLAFDIEYYQVGGVAEYTQDTYTPYLVGTIGAARFSPSGDLDSETRFAATLGGGVKWFVSKNIALKFEGRGFISIFDSNTDVFCVSSGGATCRFRVSGSVVWQLEANAGVVIRF